jgi:hypothetical protein
LLHDLSDNVIQRFLIEDIITHSSVFRASQEAEATKGICEPFPAGALREHREEVLGHQ